MPIRVIIAAVVALVVAWVMKRWIARSGRETVRRTTLTIGLVLLGIVFGAASATTVYSVLGPVPDEVVAVIALVEEPEEEGAPRRVCVRERGATVEPGSYSWCARLAADTSREVLEGDQEALLRYLEPRDISERVIVEVVPPEEASGR